MTSPPREGARRQKCHGTVPPQRHWRVSGADWDPPPYRVSDSNMRDAGREHVLHLKLTSEKSRGREVFTSHRSQIKFLEK